VKEFIQFRIETFISSQPASGVFVFSLI